MSDTSHVVVAPAQVYRFHKGRFLKRKARGFSPPELKSAGVTRHDAVGLGIPVDSRRQSEYESNVIELRRITANSKNGPVSRV